MIVFRQEITISHNEPKAYIYRKMLLQDGWEIISEDTIRTVYERSRISELTEVLNEYTKKTRNTQ